MKRKKRLTLTYKDWTLKSDARKTYSHLFDLYVKVPVEETVNVDGKKVKTGNTKMVDKLVGYGYTFHRALDIVAHQAVSNEHDILEMREYAQKLIEEYEYLKEKLVI